MELFDTKTKELLCSNYFFNEEFYDLKIGNESFFIIRKVLSKLYYYDFKTGNIKRLLDLKKSSKPKIRRNSILLKIRKIIIILVKMKNYS